MSEDLIKQEFIRENIEKDFRAIFEAQRLIALERIYTRTNYSREGRSFYQEQGYGCLVKGSSGELLKALRNPVYSINLSGVGVIATSNVPLYIRFLDMKAHGNYGIYNRQIWGILYNNTLMNIRDGYGKEVRERIYAKLQEAFPGDHE